MTFFCSQLLAELNLHSSAEQKPPFKICRSTTDIRSLTLLTYSTISYSHLNCWLYTTLVFMIVEANLFTALAIG